MKQNLTAAVATRVSIPLRKQFIRKAKKEAGMRQSDILRALIHAYVNGNIVIQPTATK